MTTVSLKVLSHSCRSYEQFIQGKACMLYDKCRKTGLLRPNVSFTHSEFWSDSWSFENIEFRSTWWHSRTAPTSLKISNENKQQINKYTVYIITSAQNTWVIIIIKTPVFQFHLFPRCIEQAYSFLALPSNKTTTKRHPGIYHTCHTYYIRYDTFFVSCTSCALI